MKKFALIPALALLILGACSDDTPGSNPVPDAPVITVPAVADQVTLDIPTQNEDYEYDRVAGSACYKFTYSNGQQLTLDIDTRTMSPATIAIVRKIEGTAADVVIPPTCRATMNNELTDIPIICLNLYQESVPETVKTITVAKSVDQMLKNATYVNCDGTYLNNQIKKAPSVEKVELEAGFAAGTLVSVDGAIYSGDFNRIISVPRGMEGVFTVAEGVKTIGSQSFFRCNKITGITFPASVETIEEDAVTSTDKLGLINMLPASAPKAEENSFGHYAFDGVLRIPTGSKENYTFAKPEIEAPIEPAEPAWDASDAEWDAYDIAYAKYEEDLAIYTEANEKYDNHCVFNNFKNVQEVSF